MATAARIGQPARIGAWGITFNSMDDPTEVVILQYSDGDERSHRHTERFRITGRLPWEGWSELKGALCSKFGVPPGVAAGLVNELIAKAISPKVTDADLGYRPVR